MSKPQILLIVGPPGSGKSNLALTLLDTTYEGAVRVSQDEQGKGGHMEVFNRAILDKKDIIIDRMNHVTGQRRRYLEPAVKAGYETRIIVLHVGYETCLQRCVAREGHPTIQDEETAKKALHTFFSQYNRVENHEVDSVTRYGWTSEPGIRRPKAIVCDLDGTLTDVEHRRYHVRVEKPQKPRWDLFFKGMIDDPLHEWCRDILRWSPVEYAIVFATGRPADYKDLTLEWLKRHEIQFDDLFTRLSRDSRKDSIVKEIILEFEIKTKYDIYFIIDDRQQVVDMWRSHGYTVLQCAKGNF